MTKKETSTSDIDLVVIVKDQKGQSAIEGLIDPLVSKFALEFHTSLEAYILTQKEFKKRFCQKIKLIKEIVANNRLILGEPLERIVA